MKPPAYRYGPRTAVLAAALALFSGSSSAWELIAEAEVVTDFVEAPTNPRILGSHAIVIQMFTEDDHPIVLELHVASLFQNGVEQDQGDDLPWDLTCSETSPHYGLPGITRKYKSLCGDLNGECFAKTDGNARVGSGGDFSVASATSAFAYVQEECSGGGSGGSGGGGGSCQVNCGPQ